MLQKCGRVDVVASTSLAATAGRECTTKGVKEFVYPTAFENLPGPASSPTAPSVGPDALAPSQFEKRDVGYALTAEPTVLDDGRISCVIAFDFVGEPSWVDYSSLLTQGTRENPPQMKQPIFRTVSVNTTVIVNNAGKSLVLAAPVPQGETNALMLIIGARTLP